ncbi:ABC transporter permease [Candidatus Woesearchaeota archaeon]|nr:ABC transporter permease [Candidatus Woesearchaeota archaeon]
MRWNTIKGLLLKHCYTSLNSLDRIFDLFYWPLLSLVLWGFTTYYLKGYLGNMIVAIFIGGATLFLFFERTQQDISVFILEDFWSRSLFVLFTSPVTATELIASTLIFGFARSIITLGALLIAGSLIFSFYLFSISAIWVLVFLFLLILLAWAFSFFIIGLVYRYGMKIQVFAWSITWLIQPFSAVYYPVASLPPLLQKVSWFIPLTHIFEGFRELLATGTIHSTFGLWYAFFVTIALLFLSVLYLERSLRKALKEGLFVHPI